MAHLIFAAGSSPAAVNTSMASLGQMENLCGVAFMDMSCQAYGRMFALACFKHFVLNAMIVCDSKLCGLGWLPMVMWVCVWCADPNDSL